jgi:uncharacterized protein
MSHAETRAQTLIRTLHLQPHPEGGWYAEVFRSSAQVQPGDARPARAALTTIDFLLERGQFSAWHRVASDEVWHLLEAEAQAEGAADADGLSLWTLPPDLGTLVHVRLGGRGLRRHVVPAGWWQAAEPEGAFAYVGATVGPGFDFADFAFGRDDAALVAAAQRLQLQRLL